MATIISTKTSGVGGLEVTGDASGVLQLASNNGTTAVTVDASQNVTFAGSVNAPNTFSFKNRIINGAMMIDQRFNGASGTSGGYTVDRWNYQATQGTKATWQRNAGSVTPPVGFTNYLGLTSSSSYSILTGDAFWVYQSIEGLNVSDLAWGTANAATVTLSFWVRSSLTGTFGGSISNNGNTRSYPFSYSIPSANTWTQISVTIAGDTTGTWLTTNGVGINVNFSIGTGATYSGTAGSWAAGQLLSATGATSVVGTNGATFYITGVQLEKGSTATSFDYRPYGTELALCQRYYWRNVAGASFGCFGTGVCGSSTNVSGVNTKLPVTMRSAPTVGFSSIRLLDGTAANAASAISYQSSSTDTWSADFTGSGLTTGRAGVAQANNSTSAYIDASSEL